MAKKTRRKSKKNGSILPLLAIGLGLFLITRSGKTPPVVVRPSKFPTLPSPGAPVPALQRIPKNRLNIYV